jgi:hypothetical protein
LIIPAFILLSGCALSEADIAVASNGKLCHRYFTPIEMDYRSPVIQAELARRGQRLGHSPCDDAPYNPLTGQSGPSAVGVNPFAGLTTVAASPPGPVMTDCTTTRSGAFVNTSCRTQ